MLMPRCCLPLRTQVDSETRDSIGTYVVGQMVNHSRARVFAMRMALVKCDEKIKQKVARMRHDPDYPTTRLPIDDLLVKTRAALLVQRFVVRLMASKFRQDDVTTLDQCLPALYSNGNSLAAGGRERRSNAAGGSTPPSQLTPRGAVRNNGSSRTAGLLPTITSESNLLAGASTIKLPPVRAHQTPPASFRSTLSAAAHSTAAAVGNTSWRASAAAHAAAGNTRMSIAAMEARVRDTNTAETVQRAVEAALAASEKRMGAMMAKLIDARLEQHKKEVVSLIAANSKRDVRHSAEAAVSSSWSA